MQSNFLSLSYILELFSKYSNELSTNRFRTICEGPGGAFDGGISRVDGILFYLLIRDLNLKNGLEFSYGSGYSTGFWYEALRQNQLQSDEFTTFMSWDIERFECFNDRMGKLGFCNHFKHEDALNGIPQYLYNNKLCGKIDWLWVDSCHRGDFCQKYLKLIFPLLSDVCLIGIHDMYYGGEFLNHYGPISYSDIKGTPGADAIAEGQCLSDYFRRNDYVVYSTHKLFGQSHDHSRILPRNDELCRSISNVYSEFDYPASQQHGGNPRSCMSLIALKSDFWAGLEIIHEEKI